MYPTFLVFGPPNAGKGMLVEGIIKAYHVNEIGTGNICRREQELDSDIWREAQAYMEANHSTLWPTELLMQALGDDFTRAARKGAVIIDGFLRRTDQNEHLVQLVQSHSIPEIVIIDIHTPDSICIKRSIDRDRKDDKDIHARLHDYHTYGVTALHALLASAHILPVQRLIFKGHLGEADGGAYRRDFIEGLGKLWRLRTKHSRYHGIHVHT